MPEANANSEPIWEAIREGLKPLGYELDLPETRRLIGGLLFKENPQWEYGIRSPDHCRGEPHMWGTDKDSMRERFELERIDDPELEFVSRLAAGSWKTVIPGYGRVE